MFESRLRGGTAKFLFFHIKWGRQRFHRSRYKSKCKFPETYSVLLCHPNHPESFSEKKYFVKMKPVSWINNESGQICELFVKLSAHNFRISRCRCHHQRQCRCKALQEEEVVPEAVPEAVRKAVRKAARTRPRPGKDSSRLRGTPEDRRDCEARAGHPEGRSH